MPAPLTMGETAAAVGLSKERFRKVWRAWVKARDFPRPFSEPGATYRWNADSVEAWKHAREAAWRDAALRPPRPANDPLTLHSPAARIGRDRAELAQRLRNL